MIHTNRIITVGEQESIIDRPIVLYRGDREVEIEFTLVGNEFMFSTEGNVIKSTNASHGQLVLNTPSGENMFSELAECHEGKVLFVVTKEMIDELIETGFYSFQVRLYDGEEMRSRVTIPPITNGFDIRNPIAAEDETNVVDVGLVEYSRIVKEQNNEEIPTFDWKGDYNKTEWEHHDLITENKLNKIEDAIYTINEGLNTSDNKFIQKADKMEQEFQNKVNELKTVDKQLGDEIDEVNRTINNRIDKLEVDVNVGDVAWKNEVNTRLEHVEVVNVYRVKSKDEFIEKINSIDDNCIISIDNDISIRDEVIFMKNNTTITGNGTLNISTNIDRVFDLSDCDNIKIKDLKIMCHGLDIGACGKGLFYFKNTTNVSITNCKIECDNRCIFTFVDNNSKNISIKNNKMKCNGYSSFILFSLQRNDIGNLSTNGNTNIIISDNEMYESELGLLIDCDDSKIINNYFYKVNAPIACLKVKNTIISENIIRAFKTNGICVGNGSDDLIINVVISNNVLDGRDNQGNLISEVHGINVYKQGGDGDPTGANHPNITKSRHLSIIGNVITNVSDSGIFAYGNGNLTITGNSCTNCTYGILAGGGGNYTSHPGKVIISSNITQYNTHGIGVGDSSYHVPNCIISNNMVTNNTYRGIYKGRGDNGIISNNVITDNGGCGLLIANVTKLEVKNNIIKNNLQGTDPEGYNGQLALGINSSNEVRISDNDIDSKNSIYYIAPNNPKYVNNNKGVKNVDILSNEGITKTFRSYTGTVNVLLPTSTSCFLSGQLLIQVSAGRMGSGNINHHHSALAVLDVVRFNDTITIGEVTYIYNNNKSTNVTITALTGNDGGSLDINVNTNYQSTDVLTVIVKPINSLLYGHI